LATITADRSPADLPARPGPLSKRVRGGWAIEAIAIVALATVHDLYRNWVMGGRAESLVRAKAFTRFERAIGLYHEQAIQHFFLGSPVAIGFWNLYYDSAHFLVPICAAVYLYLKFPARYVRWRNIFLFMLFVTGPFGWATFPVTPPKYMPASYGFVDTQVKYFNIGTQRALEYGHDGEPRPDVVLALGNVYSGMPSHHVSWALWAVCALWPVVRRRWVRGLLVLHLFLTIGAITVTGNHRFVDIAGSCLEVGVAFLVIVGCERLVSRWRARARA
jgi:hypothetical protein